MEKALRHRRSGTLSTVFKLLANCPYICIHLNGCTWWGLDLSIKLHACTHVLLYARRQPVRASLHVRLRTPVDTPPFCEGGVVSEWDDNTSYDVAYQCSRKRVCEGELRGEVDYSCVRHLCASSVCQNVGERLACSRPLGAA